MAQPEILFTVVTAVYNRRDCIADCIRSVAAQECAHGFEHIVVDDGSADGTFALVSELAGEYNHLVGIALPQNVGPNGARNAAIAAARGKFVIILDSDDVMLPGALDTMARAIDHFPEDKHFMFTVSDRRAELSDQADTVEMAYRDFLEGRVSGDFTHVVLRATMLAHPFDAEVRVHEGVFFLSFYKAAGSVRFINRVLVERDRSRNDRVTFDLMPDNKETLRRNIRAIDILTERFATDFKATEAGRKILAGQLLKKQRFATMLGSRAQAAEAEEQLRELGMEVPGLWRALSRTAMGRPFFSVAKFYIKLKFAVGIRPK